MTTTSTSTTATTAPEAEAFEFSSNGVVIRGRIHLPESFEPGMDLPTIYLIDFAEQHFETALDEFETVIDSVNQIDGLTALVATLEGIPDTDANPSKYEDHAEVFRDMADHVNANYTNNPSRTFIGRGSEAGIVLLELFGEGPEEGSFENYVATDSAAGFTGKTISILETEDFSRATTPKKLHFSFSVSNNVPLATELADLIDDADYPWLEFESVYYSDTDYENTYPIAFADGLRFVFGD
jgi:hypothetical protein